MNEQINEQEITYLRNTHSYGVEKSVGQCRK